MNMPSEKMTFTVDEVAAQLGLSKNAVYLAIKRDEIPSIRIGARIVVPKVRFQQKFNLGAA